MSIVNNYPVEAGEIPWMTKQSSTWEQIFAHETEMSTISLVVKGEKVDSLVREGLKK